MSLCEAKIKNANLFNLSTSEHFGKSRSSFTSEVLLKFQQQNIIIIIGFHTVVQGVVTFADVLYIMTKYALWILKNYG
jgi:hypothetical protein